MLAYQRQDGGQQVLCLSDNAHHSLTLSGESHANTSYTSSAMQHCMCGLRTGVFSVLCVYSTHGLNCMSCRYFYANTCRLERQREIRFIASSHYTSAVTQCIRPQDNTHTLTTHTHTHTLTPHTLTHPSVGGQGPVAGVVLHLCHTPRPLPLLSPLLCGPAHIVSGTTGSGCGLGSAGDLAGWSLIVGGGGRGRGRTLL